MENKEDKKIKDTLDEIDVIRKRGCIHESEINLIKLRSTRYSVNLWARYCKQKKDFSGKIALTCKQNDFGKTYLRSKAFRSSKRLRRNSPFGYRELDILNDKDSYFLFDGFVSTNNDLEHPYYVPHYRLYSGDGLSFFGYHMDLSVPIRIKIDE